MIQETPWANNKACAVSESLVPLSVCPPCQPYIWYYYDYGKHSSWSIKWCWFFSPNTSFFLEFLFPISKLSLFPSNFKLLSYQCFRLDSCTSRETTPSFLPQGRFFPLHLRFILHIYRPRKGTKVVSHSGYLPSWATQEWCMLFWAPSEAISHPGEFPWHLFPAGLWGTCACYLWHLYDQGLVKFFKLKGQGCSEQEKSQKHHTVRCRRSCRTERPDASKHIPSNEQIPQINK